MQQLKSKPVKVHPAIKEWREKKGMWLPGNYSLQDIAAFYGHEIEASQTDFFVLAPLQKKSKNAREYGISNTAYRIYYSTSSQGKSLAIETPKSYEKMNTWRQKAINA